MSRFHYSAQYDGKNTTWSSGATVEQIVLCNVSEFIYANDELEARAIAEKISAHYAKSGISLRNEQFSIFN